MICACWIGCGWDEEANRAEKHRLHHIVSVNLMSGSSNWTTIEFWWSHSLRKPHLDRHFSCKGPFVFYLPYGFSLVFYAICESIATVCDFSQNLISSLSLKPSAKANSRFASQNQDHSFSPSMCCFLMERVISLIQRASFGGKRYWTLSKNSLWCFK